MGHTESAEQNLILNCFRIPPITFFFGATCPKNYQFRSTYGAIMLLHMRGFIESFEQKGVYLGASNFFAEDFCPSDIAFSNG